MNELDKLVFGICIGSVLLSWFVWFVNDWIKHPVWPPKRDVYKIHDIMDAERERRKNKSR